MSFAQEFNQMADLAHTIAIEKGWYAEKRKDLEFIALIHSELSEALEAYRHGNPQDDKIPKYSGIEAELADAVIRIMDYAHYRGFDVGNAIVDKMAFNRTRSYRHGGKKS